MKTLTLNILFITLLSCSFLRAEIPALIQNDTTIEEGIHLIDHNVSVDEDATLTLAEGVTLIMSDEATFLIYGGLVANGSGEKPVVIKTNPNKDAGVGFKVLGKAQKSISLYYVTFDGLDLPLSFNGLWQRQLVDVHFCIFRNIMTGEPGVVINNSHPSEESFIPFTFKQNKFVDNYSSIFVGFFESNTLKLQMENNVISRNFIFGYNTENADLSGSAPVTFLVNNDKKKYPVLFKNNSIFNNYVTSINDVYIKMSEINMGFRGTAPGIYLDQNFYGMGKDRGDVVNTIAAQNSSVILKKVLEAPAEETPLHIVNMRFHDRDVYLVENEFLPWETQNFIDSIELDFSKPVNKATFKEVILSDVWQVIVEVPLLDGGVKDNAMAFSNGKQTVELANPYSYADDFYKINKRYYSIEFENDRGLIEKADIGRVYLDVFLLESENIFSYQKQKVTLKEYKQTFNTDAPGSRIGAGDVTSPYVQEFQELERKVLVSSEVNRDLVEIELKQFKKRWKGTSEYDSKAYKRLYNYWRTESISESAKD